MKKPLLSLLLLISLTLSLFSALPQALTSTGDPELYQELQSKAMTNLKKLDKAQQTGYKALLQAHPDILMAYLIAYEPDGALAFTAPEVVASNYNALTRLIESDGLRYPAEFFLAYVAKQGVSDEALTPYRQALLDDGLQEVLDQNPNLLERYRETALWCVERLRFQPTSGRDQSPLDITQKSFLGRCEEMQILFVAAARTVGLPSRPASTPWWAHMDNNHAWAEVYLDGAWHYTGDMDAAYFPDQTWFSGMIDKTVLILADGNLAPEGEEVLYQGPWDSTINSTVNYARERTRSLRLNVVDPLGKPVDRAMVTPMVYNWASLRGITSTFTDKLGNLKLSVGRGAFYLMVYKDGLSALELIPSSTDAVMEREIVLSKSPFKPQQVILEYPSNSMTWQQAPAEYQARVEASKARIADRFAGFESSVLTRSGASEDSLLLEVIKNCRANQNEFYAFDRANQPLDKAFLELLRDGDPKFLWTASASQFEALYQFYLAQAARLEQLAPEHRQYLFDPAVFFEALPSPVARVKGKAQLYPAAFLQKGRTEAELVSRVVKYLHKQHKVKPAKALSGLLPLQLAIKQKFLNNYQFRILAVSALRANGIPAQFSRIPDLILVLIDNDWQYYNVTTNRLAELSAPSTGAVQNLVIRLRDEAGNPLNIPAEQFSITTLDSGNFYPLEQRPEYQQNGYYHASLPQKGLFLQIGYRSSDSRTGYVLRPLSTEADSVFVDLYLQDYPRNWVAAEDYLLDIIKDTDTDAYEVILLGNHDQENSMRLADKIKAAGRKFLWLGYSYSAQSADNYEVSDAWKALFEKEQRPRTITLVRNQNGAWEYYEGLWEKLPSAN